MTGISSNYSLTHWGVEQAEKLIPKKEDGILKKFALIPAGMTCSLLVTGVGLVESAVTTPFAAIALLFHLTMPNKWTWFHQNPFLSHAANTYTGLIRSAANTVIFPFKNPKTSPVEEIKEEIQPPQANPEDDKEKIDEVQKKSSEIPLEDLPPSQPQPFKFDRDSVITIAVLVDETLQKNN